LTCSPITSLAALAAFRSLTLSPAAVILSFRAEASFDGAGAVAGAATGAEAPGFQSCPVAALYSALRARSTLTCSPITSLAALAAFRSLTLSPAAVILSFRAEASFDGAGEAAGAAPGFQSWPVAALYSALRARRTLTSSPITSLVALASFMALTFSP